LQTINEADYYSPNFAINPVAKTTPSIGHEKIDKGPRLSRASEDSQRIVFVHQVGSSAKYSSNKGKLLTKLSGIFYSLVGEYLGEKLPMIIFTNRISFKVSLIHQIEFYEN
jgi:hypothetical protein